MINQNEEIYPWTWINEDYYKSILKKYKDKLKPFSKIKELKNQHYLMRRGIIFAHKDFEDIRDIINEGKRFVVVTGMMLHEKIHFGHKCVIDQIKWYQEMGAEIFIALSDIESWLWGDISIKEAIKNAMNNYLLNYLALGIKPEKCHVYSQWARKEVIYLAMGLSKYIDYDKIKDQYSFSHPPNTIGQFFFPLIVTADILHTQLKKYGGPRPIVVPVGIDQFGYLNFSIDLIAKYKKQNKKAFYEPSATFHRLLKGTNGVIMSSTREKNAIFLTESPDSVYNKLMEARTGEEENGKKNPTKCMLFDMLRFNHEEDKYVRKIFEECIEGRTLCRECKYEIGQYFANWVKKFQEKREDIKDSEKILRFMLNQDILRETESVMEITERG